MSSFRLGAVTRGLLLVAAVAAALGGGGASASGASAGGTSCSGKCALGDVFPTSVGAGARESFTFTLTNEASPQSLGSADLTPPSGFVVQSVTSLSDADSSSATAAVSAGVLQLRNLSLLPTDSVTVDLSVDVPCQAGAGGWLLQAKQANNFNGPPGNDFTTDPASSLTTTVTGACTLEFVDQPANAVAGQGITGVGFDPSGAPVEVEALDGQGEPIPGVVVTLGLAPVAGGGTGALSAATPVVTTGQSGDASFPGISINQTGYYQLEATAPGIPQPAFSSGFQITTSAASCASSCSASIAATPKTAGLSVSVSGAGNDILSLGMGGLLYSCSGYTTVSGSFGIDLWTSASGYTLTDASGTIYEPVTIEIPKQLVDQSPNNGASFYQVCYASTVDFVSASGIDAPSVGVVPGTSTPAGGGATLYAGLLPDCPSQPTPSDAPCLLSRNKTGSGNVVISFLGGLGDFWGSA